MLELSNPDIPETYRVAVILQPQWSTSMGFIRRMSDPGGWTFNFNMILNQNIIVQDSDMCWLD